MNRMNTFAKKIATSANGYDWRYAEALSVST